MRKSASFLNGEHFPDPFLDIASLSMPTGMQEVLKMCEYLYYGQDQVQAASKRITSYFVTDVEIDDAGEEEKEKYTEFFDETIGIKNVIGNALEHRQCYGNAFVSVVVPIKRFLSCPQCGARHPLRVTHGRPEFKFEFKNYEFHQTCQGCKFRGSWHVKDEQDDQEKKLKIKIWDPKQIRILHDVWSCSDEYIWEIPEDYKRDIREGHLHILDKVSLEVIKAVKNNFVFKFYPDVLYHMREPTLAGLQLRGWGISRFLTSWRQIYYVQVLKRFNEAIASDYIMPFRLITPAEGKGATGPSMDAMLGGNGAQMMGQLRNMLREHRRNPATYHTLGFPVTYQALGGDATQLAPKDLLDQGQATLLNGMGVPVELQQGTLQVQAAPVALRLFESQWQHLVHDSNCLLKWLVRQITQILGWESVNAKMKRVTMIDDAEKQMSVLQLMMGGQVSKTTGLSHLGLEAKNEERLQLEETRRSAENQSRMQEEMDQTGMAQAVAQGQVPGQAPPGGDPAAAGGAPAQGGQPGQPALPPDTIDTILANPNMAMTPEEMLSMADSIAAELLGQPDSIKNSKLRRLKGKNETLHSIVRSRMDAQRTEAKNIGGEQLLAQQFGGGQPPA